MSTVPRLAIVQHEQPPIPNLLLSVPPLEDLMSVLASKPAPWQVAGLLPRGGVCVLLGDSQVGKTFFGLELAASISTGADFLGRSTKKGAVIYLAAEGGSGLVKRLRAVVGKHPDLLSSPIGFWRRAIDVRNNTAEMLTKIEGFEQANGEIGLIVIDTLSQTIFGDENGQDMTAFVSAATTIAQVTKAPVLIVHHCGKDATRGARGNSSLRGNTDVIINVKTEPSGIRTASTDPAKGGKMRDGEPSSLMFSLKKVDVGDGETSCIVKSEGELVFDEENKKGMLKAADQKFLLQLATQIARGAAGRGELDGPNNRPTFSRTKLKDAWATAREAAGQKTSPSYFVRALSSLQEAGYICFDGENNDPIWLA